jgi:hypothetical protein
MHCPPARDRNLESSNIRFSNDGPGLRDYHNKGVRVYPETNIKRIMAKRNSMTARERTRFDADRNYRKLELAA